MTARNMKRLKANKKGHERRKIKETQPRRETEPGSEREQERERERTTLCQHSEISSTPGDNSSA